MTEEQNVESVEEQSAVESVDGAYPGWGDDQPPVKKKKKGGGMEDEEVPMPNITSLLDALFIILVFLLKSYSTNPVSVTQSASLKLAASAAQLSPKDALPVIIDKKGITVDGVETMKFDDKGEVPSDQVAGHIIAPLSQALRDQAEKQRKLAQVNTDVSFKGELILICDKDLPYKVLRDILMTAGDAEYGNFRFAVIKAAG
ncbi:MAG: biopolymer transporter ExbD [Myxococcota bacterium]|nr:biopolymer transporter ExbD [Myxococcota bacterium]